MSLNQQFSKYGPWPARQHHLGTYYKCKSSNPTQDSQSLKPWPNNLAFHKPYWWFWCILAGEQLVVSKPWFSKCAAESWLAVGWDSESPTRTHRVTEDGVLCWGPKDSELIPAPRDQFLKREWSFHCFSNFDFSGNGQEFINSKITLRGKITNDSGGAVSKLGIVWKETWVQMPAWPWTEPLRTSGRETKLEDMLLLSENTLQLARPSLSWDQRKWRKRRVLAKSFF